jgi:hypothetical protein
MVPSIVAVPATCTGEGAHVADRSMSAVPLSVRSSVGLFGRLQADVLELEIGAVEDDLASNRRNHDTALAHTDDEIAADVKRSAGPLGHDVRQIGANPRSDNLHVAPLVVIRELEIAYEQAARIDATGRRIRVAGTSTGG